MRLLLFLLCIAEVSLYTACQNIAGPVFSPVIILIVSFAIGFLGLKLARAPLPQIRDLSAFPRSVLKVSGILIFLGLSVWMVVMLIPAFKQVPMNETAYSDVMLTYIHMVKNFTHGKPAFESFSNVSYMISPAYLPFQWMPFIVSELLNFDYRWVAIASVMLASLYFFLQNSKDAQGANPFWKLIIPVWPLVVCLSLMRSNVFAFQITVESLVAGYYLLLVTAIDKNKWILLAIGLAICVLSRMSVALWVPLCLLAFFYSPDRRKAFYIAAILGLFVVVFYVPFVVKNPSLLSNPYQAYLMPIVGSWERNELMNGFSFNAWGMMFLKGSALEKVMAYQKIHFYVSCFTIVLLAAAWFKARKVNSLNNYLLFSLKIYLTVFYTFIQLPFIYLYIVPLIVTSAILSSVFITARAGNKSLI